jgi:hypothetical protein
MEEVLKLGDIVDIVLGVFVGVGVFGGIMLANFKMHAKSLFPVYAQYIYIKPNLI